MKISGIKEKRNRRKTCPSVTSSTTNITWTGTTSKLRLRGEKLAIEIHQHSTQNSVPTSKTTCHVSILQPSLLMLFKETIDLFRVLNVTVKGTLGFKRLIPTLTVIRI
jgi:hypothetical protein